jgi:TrpR-related protein YerC/YecD
MSNNYKAQSKLEQRLAVALLTLKTETDALNFLRDLLTPSELEEFGRRFEIAKLLETTDMSYDAIAKKMKTSTTTVTRVALWLNNGSGGYKKALERLEKV